MLRKTLLIVISTIICGAAYASSNDTSEKTRVGMILPLSGQLAEYGNAVRNGIEIAKQRHPGLLSNIDFYYEDSQYSGKLTIAAFQKLIRVDKVNIIYCWGSAPSQALAPIAESKKVPLITLDVDPNTARGKKYIIQFSNYGEEFAKTLVTHFNSMNYKKIAVVITEMSFTNLILAGVKKHLRPEQALEVIDSFSFEEHDFKSTIAKIKQKQVDILGVFLASGQISQFYRQAKAAGLNVKTFGTDFFESQTEIDDSQGAMEGATFPFNSVSTSFRISYVNQFKNDLQLPEAGRAFDFAILIGSLCNHNTSSCIGEKVIDLINKSGTHHGVVGPYKFSKTPAGGVHAKFPIFLKKIKDGKIQTIL